MGLQRVEHDRVINTHTHTHIFTHTHTLWRFCFLGEPVNQIPKSRLCVTPCLSFERVRPERDPGQVCPEHLGRQVKLGSLSSFAEQRTVSGS